MLDTTRIHVLPDYANLSLEAAKHIFQRIHAKLSVNEQFVLGMATGSSPIGLYEELLALLRGSELDFSRFYTVNLDEYYPLKQSDPQSYFTYMKSHFWDQLQGISPTFDPAKQGLIPNGEAADAQTECNRYEDQIKQLGGIDLQILGIGTNGHIGFNEPGSPSDSRTRVIDLAPSTIKDNSVHFEGNEDAVPKQAMTMGIATILEAREIVIIASGKSKASIIHSLQTLADPTPDIPATYLFNHPQVEFFIDTSANTI